MSDGTPEVVTSDVVLSERLFDVVRSRVRFPDGNEVERVVVEHPGAVALVAIDEDGRWLLVRQYRHPARSSLVELPAGTREEDEPPEVTAARELREETGFAASSLVRLGGAWAAPGFCSEYIHYYLATDLRDDPLAADDDEYLEEPIRMTIEEIGEAIDAGEIEDAKTLVALSLYERWRLRAGSREG